MKSPMSAIGLALAIAAASAPAAASQQPPAAAQAPPVAASPTAHKALLALQEAIAAKDVANIPARLAAAEAVATTPADRYLLGGMRFKAAELTDDDAARAVALEAVIASGMSNQESLPGLYGELANAYIGTGQKDRAATAVERMLALRPAHVEATLLFASLKKDQGQSAEAVAQLQKSIAAANAAQGKADERLYKHAVQLAYDAKLPVAADISRRWIEAYPTGENWRNAMRIYRNLSSPPEPVLVDLLRLGRVVNALDGPIDYQPYAFAAIQDRAPAEAKALIEEGIAAGKIDGGDKQFRDILAEATMRSDGQRDRLPELARDALASPSANMAVTAANIYYSYGDFAEAAELYKAASSKTGADKDLVNLRLGMALARAGDKAGAEAALNAVGGQRAEIAKYWLIYLQTGA